MESEQKRDPTPQDLQDLRIKASNLGRGDIIHKIDNDLSALAAALALARKRGWNDYLRESWNNKVTALNMGLAQAKMEKAGAKEKGLL